MISKKSLTKTNCSPCNCKKAEKKTKRKYKRRNPNLNKESKGLHRVRLNYKAVQK
jgi:hypothetical protein